MHTQLTSYENPKWFKIKHIVFHCSKYIETHINIVCRNILYLPLPKYYSTFENRITIDVTNTQWNLHKIILWYQKRTPEQKSDEKNR